MNALFKLLLALAPLLLTVLFGWLVMDGHLNFGGGEKDIFLLVPLLLWSFGYLGCFLALWWRRFPLRRLLWWSVVFATGLIIAASLILFAALFLFSSHG